MSVDGLGVFSLSSRKATCCGSQPACSPGTNGLVELHVSHNPTLEAIDYPPLLDEFSRTLAAPYGEEQRKNQTEVGKIVESVDLAGFASCFSARLLFHAVDVADVQHTRAKHCSIREVESSFLVRRLRKMEQHRPCPES